MRMGNLLSTGEFSLSQSMIPLTGQRLGSATHHGTPRLDLSSPAFLESSAGINLEGIGPSSLETFRAIRSSSPDTSWRGTGLLDQRYVLP